MYVLLYVDNMLPSSNGDSYMYPGETRYLYVQGPVLYWYKSWR